MALFSAEISESSSVLIHRLDPEDALGSCCARPFTLDEREWSTAEHYMQANRFTQPSRIDAIRLAADANAARKLASRWYWRPRRNWKKLAPVYMSRALYTQIQLYPDLLQALLDTDDRKLLAMEQYDYFWGVGRDHRGLNWYGRVLENLREKCRSDRRKMAGTSAT